MNIILLGLPGSGKGTQAKILAGKRHLFYFEAGRFSRRLAKRDLVIREIVNKGKLIPEKKMTRLVIAYLNTHVPKGRDIVFEGFPRFIGQYKALASWLIKTKRTIPSAFLLSISQGEAVKRLSVRRTCAKCGQIYNLITNPPQSGNCQCGGDLIQREDDQPQIIRNRFQEYKKKVEPFLTYLKKEKNLTIVDGEQPINKIAVELGKKLDGLK